MRNGGQNNDTNPGSKMKRLFVVVGILVGLMVPVAAQASQSNLNLNWDNISGAQCKTGSEKLLVNVSYTLTNDYDSGFAGNAWANDTVNRNLRVWQVGSTFCAQTSDRGSFTTFAGTSPSGLSTVSAGVSGDIAGGYVSTFFTGTYSPGTYATHGDLGTFDLHCTDANNCPGARPTPQSYFSSTTGFDLRHWGWIYHADTTGSGVWLDQDNVPAASSGDISGSSAPAAS
jgi:hypothetical protein